MPPTQDLEQASAAESNASAGGGTIAPLVAAGTRIDPPHTRAGAVPSPVARHGLSVGDEPADGESAEFGLADGPAQIVAQAAQLAALLDERQQELDQRQSQLDRREAAFAQEVREARFRLSQRRRQIDQRQTARQRVLQRQSERLDRRRASLEASRRQAAHMRQEALELRLATQQLHAQLAGSVDEDSLADTLAGLRQRLADHFRDEARELTRRQSELELLKAELAGQYEKFLGRLAQDKGHDESL